MPQAHQWFYPWEINREPTNEELEVMANLAVSYGARGLMWWWYLGYNGNIGNCPIHTYGMSYWDVLREQNVYEETRFKWHAFRDIGYRMKVWEPYLLSFDNANRHTYIYHTERLDMTKNSYIRDIVTYINGEEQPYCELAPPETPPWPGKIYDCPDVRYIQIATFKNPEETSQYLMIVNRRCSPYRTHIEENGGLRYIRIWFNAGRTEFEGTDIWKVIDLIGDRELGTFNKTQISYVNDNKEFMPGEGRLYKITPIP